MGAKNLFTGYNYFLTLLGLDEVLPYSSLRTLDKLEKKIADANLEIAGAVRNFSGQINRLAGSVQADVRTLSELKEGAAQEEAKKNQKPQHESVYSALVDKLGERGVTPENAVGADKRMLDAYRTAEA